MVVRGEALGDNGSLPHTPAQALLGPLVTLVLHLVACKHNSGSEGAEVVGRFWANLCFMDNQVLCLDMVRLA